MPKMCEECRNRRRCKDECEGFVPQSGFYAAPRRRGDERNALNRARTYTCGTLDDMATIEDEAGEPFPRAMRQRRDLEVP